MNLFPLTIIASLVHHCNRKRSRKIPWGSTNSFRFSLVSQDPNNTIVISPVFLLLIYVPSASPPLHFKSTAPKCATVEYPGHNILTQCQDGRHACKISANIYSRALEVLWQLSFTRTDINLLWHQLRNRTSVDSKYMTAKGCFPIMTDTGTLFMLKTTSIWWKLTLRS